MADKTRVQITLTFTTDADSGTLPEEVVARFREIIRSEWAKNGEDLMGYEGPFVKRPSFAISRKTV